MSTDPQAYLTELFGCAGKRVIVTGAAEGLGKAMAAGALISSGAPETYAFGDWQATLAVNLTGSYLCAQAAGRELAVEWARYGIRVNSIAPCHFRTRSWQQAMADPAGRAAVARVISGIPMGRMGEADEIVGAVLFLASPGAAMVNGAVLPVDGGNLALNATHGGVLSPSTTSSAEET
jgi:NAD(P)-dependent dehydrogenase (short-subunit alcohol dehydrogenase family)